MTPTLTAPPGPPRKRPAQRAFQGMAGGALENTTLPAYRDPPRRPGRPRKYKDDATRKRVKRAEKKRAAEIEKVLKEFSKHESRPKTPYKVPKWYIPQADKSTGLFKVVVPDDLKICDAAQQRNIALLGGPNPDPEVPFRGSRRVIPSGFGHRGQGASADERVIDESVPEYRVPENQTPEKRALQDDILREVATWYVYSIFYCGGCGANFGTEANAVQHITAEHTEQDLAPDIEQRFRCALCHFEFAWPHDIISHVLESREYRKTRNTPADRKHRKAITGDFKASAPAGVRLE
jgi:hypothetical protein